MESSHKDVKKKRSPVDYLSSLLGTISMWGVPVVVCVIFYEVTMRYVFVSLSPYGQMSCLCGFAERSICWQVSMPCASALTSGLP